MRKTEGDEQIAMIQKTELTRLLMKLSVDVAEMYSPPRVTKEGKKWGLEVGEAMDLLTGWDFDLISHREAALAYVDRVKPKLVIGSPMCTYFSSLQNLNKERGSEAWTKEYNKAVKHLEFMVKVYRKQMAAGRWFLHEHPENATSWSIKEMKEMAAEHGVQLTVVDQCAYGLKT